MSLSSFKSFLLLNSIYLNSVRRQQELQTEKEENEKCEAKKKPLFQPHVLNSDSTDSSPEYNVIICFEVY